MFENGFDIDGAQVDARIDLVGQELLRPLGFTAEGQVDDALHLGESLETQVCRPPVRPQIPNALFGSGNHQAIRPADHRPAFG